MISLTRYIAINPVWLVITMLVFFALVKLGFWQSQRGEEKTQRIEKIQKLIQSKPFDLSQILTLAASGEIINDLPVLFNGTLNDKQLILLDNQMNNGRFGFRVLQIVQAQNHAVLVNLGWHLADRTRQKMVDISPLTGDHDFLGHVRLIEKGIVLQEQSLTQQTPLIVQQIELEKLSVALNIKLLPFVIYLDQKMTLGYEKNWQPIVMPPEKHHAYAFQWFSLALAWLSLMVWSARKAKIIKINQNNKA